MTLLYMDPMITAYVTVLAAILGLCFGSFLNCWAWRSTHNMSIMRGHSICPECKHELGLRDLVPVFSWLFNRGKCHYCGAPVSKRYPLTELLCAVIFVSIVLTHGLTLECAEFLLIACALFFLTLTDIDDFIIPNGCIIFILVVRWAYLAAGFFAVSAGQLELAGNGIVDVMWDYGQTGLPMNPIGVFLWPVVDGLIIAVPLLIIVLVMDKVLGKPSMGGGDLKLFFAAGCVFGWAVGLLIVIASCVFGIVLGLVQSRKPSSELPVNKPEAVASSAQDSSMSEEKAPSTCDSSAADASDIPQRAFPFGPSLALACWLAMLVGPQLITWYVGLL